MTRTLTQSLWVKQTSYTIMVVAAIATVASSIEIVTAYHHEHDRQQQFGTDLIDSFSDAAARAAFHVDTLQAEAVVHGLLQYGVLDGVRIHTDLGVELANETRTTNERWTDIITDWLFSDVSSFKRDLAVDRSEFVSGTTLDDSISVLPVGYFEIHTSSAMVGRIFISDTFSRLINLAIQFLILAAALAFLFYRMVTKPLEMVAEELGNIDPHGTDLANLHIPEFHRNDELGQVVSGTNELLNRIGEQQADLIHREKIAALGSMLAEVAHELNNPLAVVIAQAELLAETATDQKTRDRAHKILNPAMRSASIVRKFLTLARQRKIEKTVLDVRGLIHESIDMLSYQLDTRDIVVHMDIQSDVSRIWGDGAQLGQVLINILVNAQQALLDADHSREITIRASSNKETGTVIISISDNGPGIPDDIRHKVFKHFFTTKSEGRGTGLGLSYCKSTVEAHGGSIVLKNIDPHGTEVIIELPGTTQSAVDSSRRAHPGQAIASLHVLVVDDEEQLARSIEEVLLQYGHTAKVVISAKQAMHQLKTESFDVILADVHMPGTDGMGFYRNVRDIDTAMAEKFVFVTGDSLDERLVEFFEDEERPYLNKPFEISELIRIVESINLKPRTRFATHDKPRSGSNV